MSKHRLDPLMNPRSVAYVGASETPGSPGCRLIQVAQSYDYAGTIYPINPKYETVQGLPCYGSLGELPEAPDLAILSVSSKRLEAQLEAAIEAGARAAVIYDTCYLPDDPDRKLLKRLRELARDADMAVCGGNGPLDGFLHLRGHDPEARFHKLFGEIAALKPSRLVILSHPHDAVIAALPFKRLTKRTVFVHHANHGFFLGGGLQAAKHVVLAEFDMDFVLENYRAKAHVLPLTCTDPFEDSGLEDAKVQLNEPFVTATAGSPHKFSPRLNSTYSDLLQARFRTRGGRHVHIGTITDAVRREIDTALGTTGANARFEHIPFVPSLSDALAKLSPDVYFVSHPTGGGKSSVEAMAAACPVAVSPRGSSMDGDLMLYPGHMRWDSPLDLERQLDRFTDAEKRRHAALARAHFLNRHGPAAFGNIWREVLDRPIVSGS